MSEPHVGIVGRTAADLAAAIASGELSAVEVAQAHLDRSPRPTASCTPSCTCRQTARWPRPARSTPRALAASRSARSPASRSR